MACDCDFASVHNALSHLAKVGQTCAQVERRDPMEDVLSSRQCLVAYRQLGLINGYVLSAEP